MINKSLWFCSSLPNNEVTKDKNEECYKIKCKLACVRNNGGINEVELVLFHFQMTILTCAIAKPTKRQPGLAGGGGSVGHALLKNTSFLFQRDVFLTIGSDLFIFIFVIILLLLLPT